MTVPGADGRQPTVTRAKVARLVLDETADGWRLTMNAAALRRLAALIDDGSGMLATVEGGELTVELHPNLVPGEPFDVTSIVIADED